MIVDIDLPESAGSGRVQQNIRAEIATLPYLADSGRLAIIKQKRED
jgi:hypothetical protein